MMVAGGARLRAPRVVYPGGTIFMAVVWRGTPRLGGLRR
jgi:hypothetical protein